MTEYICPECFKNFGNKKDHLERHINRKKSCVKTDLSIPKNILLTPQTPPNPPNFDIKNQKILNMKNDKYNNTETKNDFTSKFICKFICEFCNGCFVKKYNLDRHIKICKEKDKIDNKNKETDEKLSKIDEKLNIILKQNEDLKKENKELKKQIKTKKNKSILGKKSSDVNINIVNNIVNNNNSQQIVNFNNMNLNNVDKNLFINPLMNSRLIGKGIILKMIENIYINVNLPEYQNIIITDKNRGYVKIYNNGQWKTDNLKIINTVIDGIVEHSKPILEELNQRYINNNQAKNRLNTSKKYINLCDNEYLEELEYGQENEEIDNINQIKRCKDFRDMVFKDTINLFHDNKNILLKPKSFDLMDL